MHGARADSDAIFADSFGAECGNNVVEVPETCDGNCPACTEVYPGYFSTGSPASCDVICHIPIQQCKAGDGVCPLVAATIGPECGSASDAECLGTAWKNILFQQVNTISQSCVIVRVYGIQPGGSYDATTCAPTAELAGAGDTMITTVADNLGNSYVADNDDCTDPTALPLLAGWTCNNDGGQPRMSCASPNPAGFIVPASVTRLDITVCRFGNDGGIAPLYIWYNATMAPNPG